MDDLKTLTVRYLRELARKHLGKGFSQLKTRDELIAALKKAVPEALKPPKGAPEKAGKRSEPAPAGRPKTKAARVVQFGKSSVARPRPGRAERAEAPPEAGPAREHAAPTGPPDSHRAGTPPLESDAEAAPLVEGFFVAKVAGEAEARRHHLTEEQAAPVHEFAGKEFDENLGELPDRYDDDAAVLLPRDPHTLFFFWDFQAATRAAARAGLVNPRSVIRVYDGESLVRELDFALESKSFYLHGLAPGRPYRVEAHWVGEDGRSHRLGPSTNLVALPQLGASRETSVRFLRIPWTMPLRLLRQYLREGRARIEQLAGEVEYLATAGFGPPGSLSRAFGGAPSPGEAPGPGRGWFPPPSGRPY